MVMGTGGAKEQQNPEAPKICPPNPKTADLPKGEEKEQQKKNFVLTFQRISSTQPSENAMMSIVPVFLHLTFMRVITKTKSLPMRTWKSVTT